MIPGVLIVFTLLSLGATCVSAYSADKLPLWVAMLFANVALLLMVLPK